MVLDFREEYHPDEVLFSSHHVRKYMMSIGLITRHVDLDHNVKTGEVLKPL